MNAIRYGPTEQRGPTHLCGPRIAIWWTFRLTLRHLAKSSNWPNQPVDCFADPYVS